MDEATGVDVAHNLAECSNMGKCNREIGRCNCHDGFFGHACDKMMCPNECNGHGVCRSMRYFARQKDPGLGTIFVYEDVWDADKVFGCDCDNGYTGYDCSLRHCPVGDDPLTTTGDYEVQIFTCKATSGSFTLTWNGVTSSAISVGASLFAVQTIVEAMSNIQGVTVTFSEVGDTVCSTSVNQVVSVTFTHNFGDVQDMYTTSTATASCGAIDASDYDMCGGSGVTFAYDGDSLTAQSTTVYAVTGSKENLYCSGRGSCELTSGLCSCYSGYDTSDGHGNEGNRGDCGNVIVQEITNCPGEIACSGHGFCSGSPDFTCTCSVGWTSGDCSERSCPLGKSWFDLPIADNSAHQPVECSNMGVCDKTTGICECYNGFEGSACQYKSCPGSPDVCNGHGQCLSMAQLAAEATLNGDSAATTYGNIPNDPYRWDFDMMQGCLCDEGYQGYDCSIVACPTGDDPDTGYHGASIHVHEKQLLRCTASSGTFVLRFRRQITSAIAYDATAATVKAGLEGLSSISEVNVEYSDGSTFCRNETTSPNVVTVTFLSELGDVPPLTATYGTTLAHSVSATIEIATDGTILGNYTSATGTMENEECSNRGVCDYNLGVCRCFAGYGSSNGNRLQGDRGDCGWRIPYYRGIVE